VYTFLDKNYLLCNGIVGIVFEHWSDTPE